MASKIPEALLPLLQVPSPQSLTLVTNVLGASSNWITIRFLFALLKGGQASHPRNVPVDVGSEVEVDNVAVIFASWLRPLTFWQAECKRVSGLDLAASKSKNRFFFIDALTSLFLPADKSKVLQPNQLCSPTLSELDRAVADAVTSIKATQANPNLRIVLVLDSPSIVLHTSSPKIQGQDLARTVLSLRSLVDSVIVSLPAEESLLSPDQTRRPTPLEQANSVALIGLAHQADTIVGCRLLETGWANDVSGVVRVTTTSVDPLEDEGATGSQRLQSIPTGEWLYYIAGDGHVNVWDRGSMR